MASVHYVITFCVFFSLPLWTESSIKVEILHLVQHSPQSHVELYSAERLTTHLPAALHRKRGDLTCAHSPIIFSATEIPLTLDTPAILTYGVITSRTFLVFWNSSLLSPEAPDDPVHECLWPCSCPQKLLSSEGCAAPLPRL